MQHAFRLILSKSKKYFVNVQIMLFSMSSILYSKFQLCCAAVSLNPFKGFSVLKHCGMGDNTLTHSEQFA